MAQKYFDVALSIFFIIVSVLLYGSADTESNAVSQASKDSTTIYVNFIALSLGFAAFVQLILSLFKNNNIVEFTKQPKKFLSLSILLVLYVWIMQYIGFFVATMLFLPLIMWLMGYQKPILSLIISAAITFFVYLLFEVGFDILLPEITLF